MHHDTEHLPIDIHYNKLLDWLISRRHCGKEWQVSCVVIREKINAALQDMPEVEEIRTLLEGAYINYFHCLKIFQLLKDTESGSKNIFGTYSSKRLKDWSEIVKLYEKDGVYLGEVAQMIARNVNYEVPALKKQIARCQQTQKDCTRKQEDYGTQSTELRRKYESSCKKLGIQGSRIKSELAALARDLPTEFSRIVTSSKSLKPAINLYRDFTSFVTNRDESGSKFVPMLSFVIENGDVTTYRWKHGREPERVEETSLLIDTADEEEKTEDAGDDIDWDIVDDQINLDDDINLDITDITVESGGALNDITTEVSSIDYGDIVEQENISSKEKESGDGVARGNEALSILDNPDTRTEFINDLLELESFLKQRVFEMSSSDDVLTGSQFQSAPLSIQLDASKVKDMLNMAKNILSQLTSEQMQHLLFIRNSPRYVERLRDSLKQTLVLADKMVFHQKQMGEKRKLALEEQASVEPKLDVLVSKTKVMQKQMEEEVSKKYGTRPVNIMGEINTI